MTTGDLPLRTVSVLIVVIAPGLEIVTLSVVPLRRPVLISVARLTDEPLDVSFSPRPRSFFGQLVDEKVLEAVDVLPPEFREVLVLSDVEGLRYAEIAEALQVPVGTVKSRLFRARRLLQARLYAYAVEMGYIKPREGAHG